MALASFSWVVALCGGVQMREVSPCSFRGHGWVTTRPFCLTAGCRYMQVAGNSEAEKLEFRCRRSLQCSRHQGHVGGAHCMQQLPLSRGGHRVVSIFAISRVVDSENESYANDGGGAPDSSSPEGDGAKEVKIDLQLPRRRLLVEFTCNVCHTRTQRLINPDAYKRGTVYIQCGGCEAYHQLVDNLGLVVEYDFREETDSNS